MEGNDTVKAGSKQRSVFETLRRDLLSGRYASGKFPSERMLMARFHASRGLIRHVMRELMFAGFINARPRSGYVVSAGARNLGGCIGLIVPGVFHEEIFSPICQEISRMAHDEGYVLLFDDISGADEGERARRAVAVAADYIRRGVSGVIFQPIEFIGDSLRINGEIVKMFKDAGVPVVLLDYDIVPPPDRSAFDLVCIDNFNAGRAVARHLVGQGARRIVFLMRDNWAFSVQERLAGCRFAVQGAKGAKVSVAYVEADDEKGVRALVSGRQAADAIVCGNDMLAARLLRTLKRIGRKVPEDVMVSGFDDIECAVLVTPPLTTIHQPCAAMARSLFDALRARMRDPSSEPRTIVHHSPLVVRASTVIRPL